MEKTVLSVFVILLLVQRHCCKETTRAVGQPQLRIVGGTDAVRGEFPYQGELEIEERVGSLSILTTCGCSLIHSRWAVTAAHCVEDKRVSDLSLYFGQVRLSDFETAYSVLRIHRHPFYSDADQDLRYDIALLEIAGNVSISNNVSPILLPVSQGTAPVGQLCTITGWGSVSAFSSIRSQVLQKAEVPIVSNARCDQTYGGIFPEHICAGYESGGVDICTGDSGAPLVCTSPAGNPVLQGIGSFGSGCARPRIPSGYARVSSLVEWIQTTTGSDEIETDESTLIVEETTRNKAVISTTGSDEVNTDESTFIPEDTTGGGAITAASRATTSILAATVIVILEIINRLKLIETCFG